MKKFDKFQSRRDAILNTTLVTPENINSFYEELVFAHRTYLKDEIDDYWFRAIMDGVYRFTKLYNEMNQKQINFFDKSHYEIILEERDDRFKFHVRVFEIEHDGYERNLDGIEFGTGFNSGFSYDEDKVRTALQLWDEIGRPDIGIVNSLEHMEDIVSSLHELAYATAYDPEY